MQELVAACPALVHAEVCIEGAWQDVAGAMRLLPGLAGPGSSASIRPPAPYRRDSTASFAVVAAALAEAVSACSVDTLTLTVPWSRPPEGPEALDAIATAAAAAGGAEAAATAAAALGAALAHPAHGPARLYAADHARFGLGAALSHALRALTPASRLRTLQIQPAWRTQGFNTGSAVAWAADLAAALEEGRAARLESLKVIHTTFIEDDRCAQVVSLLSSPSAPLRWQP